jgi:hypothetical protein
VQLPVPQAVQVPLALQYMPALPQGEPAVLFPLSLQMSEPVEHDEVPVLQGLAGVHVTLAVQALQVPLLHTRFVPQGEPSASAVFESTQLGAPEVHVSAPLWQALAGVQDWPLTQAAHVPVLVHTMSLPQLVPAGLFVVSVHTDDPVEHEVVPFLQGLVVGWQTLPA